MFLEWSLASLAQTLDAELIGENRVFQQFSIDTRTLEKGACYIAIRGDRFDGHDFIQQAVDQGAAALIVEQAHATTVPQLIVKDTRLAMGRIAARLREQITVPVIGLTGSCGKTTVKEMIAAILSQHARVLATQGNLNNDIGLPLTLFRYDSEHQFVVLEMGMNHLGEIRYLNNIAKPDVVLINNAKPVHLEGVGDLAGVAKAKGEILESLNAGTVAVLPKEDPFHTSWCQQVTDNRTIHFASHEAADVYATDIQTAGVAHTQFTLHILDQRVAIDLPLAGEHNVHNALAAASACHAIGVTLAQIKTGLESVRPANGRLNVSKNAAGVTIIDDSYNANPEAVKKAIDLLVQTSPNAWLVLADMGELGAEAVQYHQEIGTYAKDAGIKHLYCVGPLSEHISAAFGAGAKHFHHNQALINALQPKLSDGDFVLIKGSRSMRLEEVVNVLKTSTTEKTIC